MKNLLLRAISGTLYVALIVGSLCYSSVAFMFLCMAFGIFGVMELSVITSRRGGLPCPACPIDIFGIICLTLLMVMIKSPVIPGVATGIIFGVCYLIYMLCRLCAAIYSRSADATPEVAYSLFGQLYLGIGLLSAQYLAFISTGYVLLTFLFIWINDTGAFLVGSAIGKRKLFPRLSPKKSWEGFFGGMALCVIVGLVLAFTGVIRYLLGMLEISTLTAGVILPIGVSIFATLGDLFESMLKRHAGVKDSGKLIPGHGGILDRIDSMLFVMPAATLILMISTMIIATV